MTKKTLCFIIAGIGACSMLRAAVTLNQLETFDGVHGWTSGAANPIPPAILLDSGPLGAGDNSLIIKANGGTGAGGRLFAFNQSVWTGDYLAQGIVSIAADLRNQGSTGLSIRLAFNGPGGWFVTAVAPIAQFSGWSATVFDIRPASLTSAGGTDASDTMAGVSEMRILHSSLVDFKGAIVSSSFLVDNLHAVPEPASIALASLAGIFLLIRKR